MCALFDKGEECGLLELFVNNHAVLQRLLIYTDDVILFLKASAPDFTTAKLLLDIFGSATGLRCNLNKSSISPIHCNEELTQDKANL